MKKILLVFTIFMLSCSMSFAGNLKTIGKATNKAGTACALVSGGDICGNVEDVAAVAGVGATSAAVVGASGSGIMGTMAAAGAVVGGGVVAGTALTAGTGGAGAANLMNKYVFDGNTKADKAARVGTYTGAAVGTAGSIGALAVAGAGPTGLAAIGGVVGGGMAAGAMTVLAAPIAATAIVGGAVYSVYWLFSDDESE